MAQKYKDLIYKAAYSYSFDSDVSNEIVRKIYLKYYLEKPNYTNEQDTLKWFLRELNDLTKSYSIYTKLFSKNKKVTNSKDYIIENKLNEIPLEYRLPTFFYKYNNTKETTLAITLGITINDLKKYSTNITEEEYKEYFKNYNYRLNLDDELKKSTKSFSNIKYPLVFFILLILNISLVLYLKK